MFLALYDQHCVSRNIIGRTWNGSVPYEIDFSND